MKIKTERIHGHYLVSCCDTGAVSLFSPAEYLAFTEISGIPENERIRVLHHLLSERGCSEDQIVKFSDIFLKKLEQQGWFRKTRYEAETSKLQMIYFSITTHCNMACAYCYIGDERRRPDEIMKYQDAVTILKKIKDFNPHARMAITGGEPFLHPELFEILDALEEFELKFSISTNAILIEENVAKRLKKYRNLLFVQTSLDGITQETHAITRGNTFHSAMKGIKHLMNEKISFAIAPTIHEGNLHEIYDIAHLAYSNGGAFSPNHLRRLPQSLHIQNIHLKTESLRKSIIDTFEKVNKEFDINYPVYKVPDDEVPVLPEGRCKYVCGNASYNVDVNWNGDVYPCHLLREKEFILGNFLTDSVEDIIKRGENSKTRVKSHQIPKCSKCPFVSTCAGGCRASAFYTQGTLAAEDEFCEILYKFEIDKLFHKKNIPFHVK